mmetsp:Transcript_14128/g.31975  ORF Transcript_14128/g.31975 Transcript_14128/m.31975 type:complete len:859 (-) Transcript_14128:190-2766(-)
MADLRGGIRVVHRQYCESNVQRSSPGAFFRRANQCRLIAASFILAATYYCSASSTAFGVGRSNAGQSQLALQGGSLAAGCQTSRFSSNMVEPGLHRQVFPHREVRCWRRQEDKSKSDRGALRGGREVSGFDFMSARRTDRPSASTSVVDTLEVKEHGVDEDERKASQANGDNAVSVAPLKAGGAGDLLEPAIAQLRTELLPAFPVPRLGKSDDGHPPEETSRQVAASEDLWWQWLWVPMVALAATSIVLWFLAPLPRPDLPSLGPTQVSVRSPNPIVQPSPSPSPPAVPVPQGESEAASADAQRQKKKAAYLQDIMQSDEQDASFARWYERATEAAKAATQRLTQPLGQADEERIEPVENGVPSSVVRKLRSIGDLLDDAQQDIYDETWVSLATYADLLRAYKPLFKYYNENGTPYGSLATPAITEAIKKALVYEDQHLFTSVNEFGKAVQERKIRMVEKAFAEISLAYDRYLKAGTLYAGYDPVTSIWYEGNTESKLVYTPLALAQPRIRDEVLVLRGSDKGKVGKVIWIGRDQDGTAKTTVVKLDPNPILGKQDRGKKGVREVKAYPYDWIALTRNERQSYLRDLALATAAACVSCAVTYPIDTIKSRLQSNLPPIPPGGPPDLFKGLAFNLGREAPNAGFLMAGFNFLTRQAVALPFVDANNPEIKFLLMIPVGIVANASGIFIRTPFELLNKQLQTGQAQTEEDAIKKVFLSKPPAEVWNTLCFTGSLVLLRGLPFGALQCTFYEIFKERLPLGDYDLPLSVEPLVWGALAGFLTGLLTNPPDVILTRAASNLEVSEGSFFDRVGEAVSKINAEEGPEGFLKGAWARAAYFAPEAMLWFAVYEYLKLMLPDAFM